VRAGELSSTAFHQMMVFRVNGGGEEAVVQAVREETSGKMAALTGLLHAQLFTSSEGLVLHCVFNGEAARAAAAAQLSGWLGAMRETHGLSKPSTFAGRAVWSFVGIDAMREEDGVAHCRVVTLPLRAAALGEVLQFIRGAHVASVLPGIDGLMGVVLVKMSDELLATVSMYSSSAAADAALDVFSTLLEPMLAHVASPPQPYMGALRWHTGSFTRAPSLYAIGALTPKEGAVDDIVGAVRAQQGLLATQREGLLSLQLLRHGAQLLAVAGWRAAHDAAAAAAEFAGVMEAVAPHLLRPPEEQRRASSFWRCTGPASSRAVAFMRLSSSPCEPTALAQMLVGLRGAQGRAQAAAGLVWLELLLLDQAEASQLYVMELYVSEQAAEEGAPILMQLVTEAAPEGLITGALSTIAGTVVFSY